MLKSDHSFGHGVAGWIGVEAAVDPLSLANEGRKPAWIGSGAGGREALMLGMKGLATHGINSRLAENEGWPRGGRNGEEAEVFAGTRRHAAPSDDRGTTQFNPNGPAVRVAQQEDGVGSRIGVETAGLDEGSDKVVGQAALSDQVMGDAVEFGQIGIGGNRGVGRLAEEAAGREAQEPELKNARRAIGWLRHNPGLSNGRPGRWPRHHRGRGSS